MKNNPLISVVVPVFNTQHYILETLKSISEQDYNNLQIIVLNDGSTDNSFEIITSFAESCERNITVINKENEGLSSTRNFGILKSEGEFIAFIDSDDIISKNHISSLFELVEINKLDCCFSDYEFTKINSRYGKVLDLGNVIPRKHLRLDFNLYNKIGKNIHCSSGLFRKIIFDVHQLMFNKKVSIGEDRIFIYQLLDLNLSVGYYPIKSYKYLIRPNSIMTSTSIEKVQEFLKIFYGIQIHSKYDKNLMNNSHRSKYSIRVLLGISRTIIRRSRYFDFNEFLNSIDFFNFSSFITLNIRNNYRDKLELSLMIFFPKFYYSSVRLLMLFYGK